MSQFIIASLKLVFAKWKLHSIFLILLVAVSGCINDDDPSPTTQPPATNATLSALSLSSGNLVPLFDLATLDYTATVGNSVASVDVSATTAESNASITVNGVENAPVSLNEGSNVITIKVTAEDGTTILTYTVDVTREPPPMSANASLSELLLSGVALDQVFQSTLLSYTATVGFMVDATAVTATLEDGAATLTVNASAVASGVASNPISLNEGSNNILVIVLAEDGTTTLTYEIVVTRESASTFAQRTYIKASNPDGISCGTSICGDSFGIAIAISGDTLVVGAPREASGILADPDNNSVVGSGAAYVFTRDTAGTWSQQAYLKASNFIQVSNLGRNYFFGTAVAISGDTLAISSPGEGSLSMGINGDEIHCCTSPNIKAGAVYVFTRNGAGAWSQEAYIKASNTTPFVDFGRSLALEGDTLVVGNPLEHGLSNGVNGDDSNLTGPHVGAAYVYTRNNVGIWSQHSYIKASNSSFGLNINFGASLSLSGDTLAVGAWGEAGSSTGINGNQTPDGFFASAGAVYIFTLSGADVWSQQAYIKASNTAQGDGFGGSVVLDGDTLAVGAGSEDSAATGIDGNQLDNNASASGAVYVFTRDGADTWSQQAYIKPSISPVGYSFRGVALSGDTLAVGAFGDRSAATGIDADQTQCCLASQSGAAYLFTRNGVRGWSQLSYIKASNAGTSDKFGVVALGDDGTLVVGAPGESSAASGVGGDQTDDSAKDAGAVYIFQ